MSVLMQSPGGITSVTVSTSGTTYTVNAAGQINAQNSDVAYLLGLGFTAVGGPAAFQSNPRNLLDGGNFTTNPFQRNIAGLASGGVISSAISNTVTYFADRWFAVGGSSSAILMAAVADTSVPGFSQSLKVSRQVSNANAAAINFGQVLETVDSVGLQSQQVTLSFYAKAGGNYSGGALSVFVISGTGTNQSAANMVASSWTGQSVPVSGSASLTTSMTRYSFTGNIAAGATQVGVLFTWTPTGTAGSDDSITYNGLQLEVGASASAFEHRPAEVDLGLCQRKCAVFAEPASGVVVSGAGMIDGTNTQQVTIPLPTTMWKAPTVTVSAGSFKFNIAGSATAAAGFAAGSTHTPTMATVVGTATATSGQATALQGGGGSGYVIASADF